MKKTLLIVSLVIILSGCSKSDNIVNTYNPPPPASGGHVINAGGTSFSPNSLTLAVGDTIVFTWTSGTHTTTSTAVPSGAATWDAPLTSSNTTFRYIITKTGTYN